MRLNGAALREIRVRSGLSVSALAALASIAQPTLTNLELGNRNTSPQTAKAIAEALKVPLVAILADPEQVAS